MPEEMTFDGTIVNTSVTETTKSDIDSEEEAPDWLTEDTLEAA